MPRHCNFLSIALICCCVCFCISNASAGPLLGTGFSTTEGTSGFSDNGVIGTVDYAVFLPGNFESAFPAASADYTPTLGELVYAYQVISDASSTEPFTSLTQFFFEPHNNVGSFNENGLTGSTASDTFPFFGVEWDFAPSIPVAGTSEGMVFSSSRLPTTATVDGSVDNGGVSANVQFLSVPGTVDIPEPSSALLGAFGFVLLLMFKRVRRKF